MLMQKSSKSNRNNAIQWGKEGAKEPWVFIFPTKNGEQRSYLGVSQPYDRLNDYSKKKCESDSFLPNLVKPIQHWNQILTQISGLISITKANWGWLLSLMNPSLAQKRVHRSNLFFVPYLGCDGTCHRCLSHHHFWPY